MTTQSADASPATSYQSRGGRSQALTDFKYRWPARYRSSWVAFVVLLIAVLIAVPKTLSGPSLTLVTALAGALAIAALGQTLIIMLGALDLSISAIMSLSTGIVVHYGVPGASLPKVLVLALVVPMVLSLVNGFLITVLRLNALVVTLATVGIISGGIQLWTGQSLSVTGQAPRNLQDFAQASVLRVSTVFIVAVAVCVVVALLLAKTTFGKQIAAVGANRTAARALGVRVYMVELGTFAIAGLLYGVAGILIAGYIGSPDVSSGSTYQLASITAAGIAGVLFTGGPASVASVLVSCVVLQLLDQALSILGFSAGLRVMILGLVLALAVAAITIGQYGASGLRGLIKFGGRRAASG